MGRTAGESKSLHLDRIRNVAEACAKRLNALKRSKNANRTGEFKLISRTPLGDATCSRSVNVDDSL
jgi:hypothetical protein